jgi:uncharacterized protein
VAELVCRACGAPLHPDAEVCPECSAVVVRSPHPPATERGGPPRITTVPVSTSPDQPHFWVLFASLGLMILVWFVFWFFSLNKWPWAIVGPFVSAFVYWLCVQHLFEQRTCSELRMNGTLLATTTAGAAIGILVGSLPLLVPYALGDLALIGANNWHAFSVTLVFVIVATTQSVWEEIVHRGLILRYLELKLGSWVALGSSSVIFAFYHELDRLRTPANLLSLFLLGLLLGAAYVLTRSLWVPIAIHAFFNLTLGITAGGTFGTTDTAPLLKWSLTGSPYWASGHGFWIIVFASKAIAAVLLIVLAYRRRRIVAAGDAWSAQIGRAASHGDPELSLR